MITSNVEVTFHSHNLAPQTFECNYVLWSVEILDSVDELLDFSLEEEFNPDTGKIRTRQIVELKVFLDLAQSLWMVNFLMNPFKTLTIEGVDYQVVNEGKKIDFKMFEGSVIGVHPILRFKAKQIGIQARSIHVAGWKSNIIIVP